MIDVDRAIASAVKTGKVFLGSRSVIKNVKLGKARLVVVASNCPSDVREDVEYYCGLSKIPVVAYKGTSLDLGAVCGRRFAVSVLAVREPGESDILKLVKSRGGS